MSSEFLRFFHSLVRFHCGVGLACACSLAGISLAYADETPQQALADTTLVVTSSNDRSNPAPVSIPNEVDGSDIDSIDMRGWDHLYDLLAKKGVGRDLLAEVLSDRRMPRYEPLYFSLEPRESKALYRKHNTVANRRHALGFYAEHASSFEGAERKYGVPRGVILALLQVETACGEHTGNDRVFYRLARLAAAAEPSNVEENFFQKRNVVRNLTIGKVLNRANILERLFLDHVAATFTVAGSMELHPLELRGSSGGAIGIPQFLPGNVEHFGVDGDQDGVVDVFQPADAIYSVANFLVQHGWRAGARLSVAKQRSALREYNRSEPYVSTILAMAAQLDSQIRKSR